MQELDTTVLGGLPVTVSYSIARAEPSVGIMSKYVDDWHISAINSRPCKKPPKWLYKRIENMKGEEDRLLEAMMEDHEGSGYDD
jgi:hypothetical protein